MQRRRLASTQLHHPYLAGICAMAVLALQGPLGSAQERSPHPRSFFEIDGRAKRVVQFHPESLPQLSRAAAGVVRTATVPDLSHPQQIARSSASADIYQQPSIAELSPPSLELPLPASPQGATLEATREKPESLGSPDQRLASHPAHGLPIESWETPSELIAPRYRIAELKPPIATPPVDSQRAATDRPMLRPPVTSQPGDRSQLTIQPVGDSPAWQPRVQADAAPDAHDVRLPGRPPSSLTMGSAAWVGDIRFPLGDSPHYYALELAGEPTNAATPAYHSILEHRGPELVERYTRWLLARGKCLVAKRHYERRLVVGRHQDLSDLATRRFQSELADAHGKLVSAKLEMGVAQHDLMHVLLPGYTATDVEVLPCLPARLFEPRPGPLETPVAGQQRRLVQARRLAALQVVQLRSAELTNRELDAVQPDEYLACQDRLRRAEWELICATIDGHVGGAETGAEGIAVPAKGDPASLTQEARTGQAY